MKLFLTFFKKEQNKQQPKKKRTTGIPKTNETYFETTDNIN